MKKRLKYILTFALISLAPLLPAQDCTDYHEYHCLYGDYTFFYSRQSKSALFQRGQTSELKIVTYAGEDYYVSVCAHRKFGDIHFRILEDTPARQVIYDNATADYAETIVFSNTVTRNLILEVSVPEGDESNAKERRCVGVVIQFRKTESGETGNSPGY